jgi:hypothetical protein
MPSYRVEIRASLKAVPADTDADLQVRIQEIARIVGNIPPHRTGFWESVASCLLQLDAKGWRFLHRVDSKQRLVVVERAFFKGE